MSEWIRGTLLIAVSLLSVATLPAQARRAEPQWKGDYTAARAEAREAGKLLLVHFYADWCGPCQQMDAETLHSSELTAALGERLVAVKIDSDRHQGLVELLRVEGLPADILIAPGGQIVEKREGYRTKADYLRWVNQWASRFPPPSPAPQTFVEKRPQPPADPNGEPGPARLPFSSNPAKPALVGLDGYSPVGIKTKRQWVRGRSEYQVVWQGVVYYCADEEERRQFQSSPERFAPRLLGCDPVELRRTDRAVQGSVQFGAFYDGELYLFTSQESRNQFKLSPDDFVQTRHVFQADDVIGTRLR